MHGFWLKWIACHYRRWSFLAARIDIKWWSKWTSWFLYRLFCQGLSLDPLAEVVHGYDQELPCPVAIRNGTTNSIPYRAKWHEWHGVMIIVISSPGKWMSGPCIWRLTHFCTNNPASFWRLGKKYPALTSLFAKALAPPWSLKYPSCASFRAWPPSSLLKHLRCDWVKDRLNSTPFWRQKYLRFPSKAVCIFQSGKIVPDKCWRIGILESMVSSKALTSRLAVRLGP